MAKRTIEDLDRGQLELMWSFLQMGNGKPNIAALKENLNALRQLMIQKTGGQEPYRKSHEITKDDLGTIINCIVIETMQLYLSGGLDKLEGANLTMAEKEYIEREKLNDMLEDFCVNESFYDVLQTIPAADVAPVRHAKWAYGKLHGQSGYYCSECGTGFADINPNAELIAKSHDYCPKCGAKMDGGE